MTRTLLVLALALLTACGPTYRDTTQPLTAQADFEVERYLGTWYEIARFPVSFQSDCTATTATYAAVDADTISVVNQCRQATPEGPLDEIRGLANVVGPGQLRVEFFGLPFVRAPYAVLWVDEGYETAVVGVPNGKAGWVLARTPRISAARRAEAEAVLRANGYDPALLLDTQHAP